MFKDISRNLNYECLHHWSIRLFGEELVRLLLNHPKVNLSRITSRSLDGSKLEDAIPLLRGKDRGLHFTNPSLEELTTDDSLELFFLALPHGTAAEYAIPYWKPGKKLLISLQISDSIPMKFIRNTTEPSSRPRMVE